MASVLRIRRAGALASIAASVVCSQLIASCSALPGGTAAGPKLLSVAALQTVFDWGNAFTPVTMEWVSSSQANVESWLSVEDLPAPFTAPCHPCNVGEVRGHFRCVTCHRAGPIVIVVAPAHTGSKQLDYLEFIWKKDVPLGSLGAVHSSPLPTLSRDQPGRAPDMLYLTLQQTRWLAYRDHLTLRTRLVEDKSLPELTVSGQVPKPNQTLSGHQLELSLSLPYKPPPGAHLHS